MNVSGDKQEAYWDRHYREFDQIYSHQKSGLGNLLDKILRRDMYQRLEFALANSEPIAGRAVLDVGCGSGRFCLEFAKRGARRVTGIDISQNMIGLADRLAKEAGVRGVCDFRKSSILEFEPVTAYDISIAVGLLDYIKDPLPTLAKLSKLSQELVILSFPRLFTWRAPIRKLRLLLRRCDVYFYSRSRVISLLEGAGLDVIKMEKVGKLYCVVARPRN